METKIIHDGKWAVREELFLEPGNYKNLYILPEKERSGYIRILLKDHEIPYGKFTGHIEVAVEIYPELHDEFDEQYWVKGKIIASSDELMNCL